MENEKFKSPKTNRYIYLYGPAYNDLIKNGYTEEFLLALPRIQSNKSLKSPIRTVKLTKSIKKEVNTDFNFTNNQIVLTGNHDVDVSILNNLSLIDLYNTCRTNKIIL